MVSTWREKAPNKQKFQLKTTQSLRLFQNVHRRHDFTVFFLGPAGNGERLCNDTAEYRKIKIVLYSSAIFLINDLTCDFPNLLGEQGVPHRRGAGHTSVHFEHVLLSATIQSSLNLKDLKVPQKKYLGRQWEVLDLWRSIRPGHLSAPTEGKMNSTTATFENSRLLCFIQPTSLLLSQWLGNRLLSILTMRAT